MKKITLKILLAFLLSFTAATILPRLFIILFYNPDEHFTINETSFFIGTIVTTALALILYSIAMNYLIVKRITTLSIATQKVAQGDYDIKINPIGKDEITTLEHNFNLMAQELTSNEYLNKAFVRNFSHELKTPISAIKGYAELLTSPSIDEDKRLEYSSIIETEAKRLSELSTSMINLSLLDNKTILNKKSALNVAEQIRNILQTMQPVWEAKHLNFDLELEEVTMHSSKPLLHQLWQNLISNAIKFSDDSSTIHLELKTEEGQLVFTIKNQGVPIGSEDLAFIFDLFYTGNSARTDKSSGIGLSIVKKITESLEGDIQVSSEESGLTTFVCQIPLMNP